MKRFLILILFSLIFLCSCSNDVGICNGFSEIIIRGHIDWTDYGNNIHNARNAKVKVWNEELLYERLITEIITDENGYYETTIKNLPRYGTRGRGLYLDFYHETKHAVIKSYEDFHNITILTSDVFDENVVEQNVTFGSDLCGQAFSIVQAAEYASLYVNEMEGDFLPQVVINYPATKPVGTYYDVVNKQINVYRVNYCDWDVIMHEYGHYVEDMLGFFAGGGGWHYINEDLTERFGKIVGERKAWNEGWATYFSLSGQKHLSLRNLSICNQSNINFLGNDCYDDSELNRYNIKIDIKNMWRYGVGCETSVAGFLLSLADGDIHPVDNVSYGFKAVWDLMIENKITTMSDFCEHLYAKYPLNLNEIKELESYFNDGGSTIVK